MEWGEDEDEDVEILIFFYYSLQWRGAELKKRLFSETKIKAQAKRKYSWNDNNQMYKLLSMIYESD